jgi:F-type H+-transporting ATPase subunit delta
MAEKVTIARPYAKAAFEYAREHQRLAAWSQLLATASAVVSDERVAKLLNNPRVTPEDLAGLIAETCGSSLDEHGRNFIRALAENRRLNVLPEIAAIYEVYRAEEENVADVYVTSAVQLDDAQRQRLTEALKKRLQREIRMHVDVDPSLIGGAIVRSGDLVIDGSLKSRLERLAAELTN